MRKLVSLLTLSLLFALSVAGGSAFAAEPSSVVATINSDKLVTISGFISAGAGQMVTILVTDPSGNVDYVNSAVTAGLGNFQVAYTMPSVTPGTYQVKVNTLTETSPITTTFAYGVNNDLQSLSLSKGGLDKAFASNTTEYAVSVDSRVDSITVTPTTSDSTATVKVNGTAVTSGQPSADIQLAEGINTITVAVTSLAGETRNYTIVVTKAGALVATLGAAATIDSRKQVTVSGTIDAGAGQMVTVIIADPKGDVEYVGAAISTAGGAFEMSYPLANAVNGRYTILVSALGVTTPVTTYFDYVELTNLVVSDITLSPSFDKCTTIYTAAARDDVNSVTVTPTCGDGAAKITVNGVAVTSGAASGAITLDASTNIINVIMTGQDGESSKTYVVTITKHIVEEVDGSAEATIDKYKLVAISGNVGTEEGLPVSVMITDPTGVTEHLDATETSADGAFEFSYTTTNTAVGAYAVSIGSVGLIQPVATYFMIEPGNPNLENLTLGSDATWGPAFSADRTEYDLFVPSATASVTVTPTAIDPMAVVKVNDVEVESGAASDSITLNAGLNVIQAVVTTMDGQEKTYTLNVMRNSNDATLSGLDVSDGSLSPSFAADKTNYTVTVSNTVSMVTITPTVNESTATVKVSGSMAASGEAYGPILLEVGANTIEVEVTSGDTTTQKTYTLTVNREKSKDATLRDLGVSGGSLNPSFMADTTGYAMTVDNTVTSLTVTPTTNEGTATVKVNGSLVASGNASGAINLNVGANTIKVEVTAGDGTTKQTYTITVTREKSKDATLSNLTLSSGSLSPSFLASRTGGHMATVTNTVTSLTVTPTVNEGTATVKVNGSTVTSGRASGVINLNVGKNTITVEVTAGDATTQKTYTVTVTREPSNDATLRGLSVSGGGTLKPSFATGTTSYAVTVPSDVIQVTVTPTVNEGTARVWVNGAAVTSGKASVPVIVSMGANTVKVEVAAGDGVTKKVYTVTVTRDLPSNLNLRDLSVSRGSLTPIFAVGRTNYNVSVGNEVTSLTVSATAYDSKATVRINNGSAASGSASRSVSLDEGSNAITVEVTAQNGAKQVYTITVTRASSSNAYLSSLTISSGSLSPAFSQTTPGYAVSVGNDVTSVTVTPTVADSDATVKVNNVSVASGSASGPIPLNSGPNTINIVVTAANGGTRGYTIVVTRAKSGENNLSSLTVSSGTLSPGFSANTQSYAVSVGNEVDSLTVLAEAAHPHATVGQRDGNGNAVSNPISLNVGLNVIRVVVTAESGTQKVYVLQVTRAQAQYTVTFDKNEGDTAASPASKAVYSGSTVGTLPTAPTREHYTFGGWYTGSDGSGSEFTANTPVTDNIIVYAKWVPVPIYRVDFDANSGDGQYSEYGTAYSGSAVGILPTAPTRNHYTFGGWYTGSDGSGSEFRANTPVHSDITVYAKWIPVNYIVFFYPNGEVITQPNPTSKVFSYGATVGSWRPTPPTREHYIFSGWNRAADGSGADLTDDTEVTGNMIFLAQWTPVNYAVTFDQNGGNAEGYPVTRTAPYLAGVPSLPDTAPTLAHYTFNGWNTKSDGTGTAFTAGTPVIGDITVFAKWVPASYTVTFDQNGGTAQGYPVYRTVPYEGTVVIWPADPTRSHYTFDGWKDGDGNVFGPGTPVTGDISVYAQWAPEIYTVNFNVDGGDPIDPPTEAIKTVPYGTAVGTQPTPTRTHYNFDGWYTGHNGTGTRLETTTPVAGNVEVFAKWTAKDYTVTFDANEGALIGAGSKTVTYYHEVGALPQATREHYTFGGWNLNSAGTGNEFRTNTIVTDDITVYAKWVPKTYTMSFDLNYSDAGQNPLNQTVTYPGSLGALPEPMRAHYAFDRWNSTPNGSGDDYAAGASLTSNITVYAQWTPTTYTMSFDLNYVGAGENPQSQTVTYPANLGALPQPTRAHYAFDGWNSDREGNGTGFADGAPLTSNITVYAQWIRLYDIAAGDFDGGKLIAVPASAQAGTVVTLTAQPNSGWRLKAGTLQCLAGTDPIEISPAPDGTYSFTMPAADVTATAEFEQLFTVAFDKNGGSGGNLTVTVVSGQSVGSSNFPSAPNREGFEFRGWNIAQNGSGGTWFEDDTEVIGDITVYAQWDPIYSVTMEVIGSDGGSIGADPAVGVAGTTITVSVEPEDGYRLKAGTLQYSYGVNHVEVVQVGGTYRFTMPAANVTVTAEFERCFTVTFDSNGGEQPANPASLIVVSGQKVGSLPTAPTRAGYVFEGWKTAADGGTAFSADTPVTGDITVYAQWNRLYSVSAGDLTGGTVSATPSVATAGTTINLVVTPADGMRLKSLQYIYGAITEPIAGSSFVMPAADVAVTAQFEEIPPEAHNVTVAPLVGGSIIASPTSDVEGTTINLTVTPNDGWRLKSGTLKYNDGSDHFLAVPSFTMPNKNVSVSAEFELIPVVTLEQLSISHGELAPGFAADETEYEVNVVNSVSSLTVMAEPTDPTATVEVTADGRIASGSIGLSVGPNVIKVKVTSEDETTTQTYTITVTRAGSSDATLSDLVIRMVIDGESDALDLLDPMQMRPPGFSSTDTEYVAYFEAPIGSTCLLQVVPSVNEPDATVKVAVDGEEVTPHSGVYPMDLIESRNYTITVEVTASDGESQMTYSVTLTLALW